MKKLVFFAFFLLFFEESFALHASKMNPMISMREFSSSNNEDKFFCQKKIVKVFLEIGNTSHPLILSESHVSDIRKESYLSTYAFLHELLGGDEMFMFAKLLMGFKGLFNLVRELPETTLNELWDESYQNLDNEKQIVEKLFSYYLAVLSNQKNTGSELGEPFETKDVSEHEYKAWKRVKAYLLEKRASGRTLLEELIHRKEFALLDTISKRLKMSFPHFKFDYKAHILNLFLEERKVEGSLLELLVKKNNVAGISYVLAYFNAETIDLIFNSWAKFDKKKGLKRPSLGGAFIRVYKKYGKGLKTERPLETRPLDDIAYDIYRAMILAQD